ncbi:type I DNA topoisomerase [Candidatus Erwinia haradaeae]|uniref:DNA topoisomerase 1 n=1 Tax=Candidatus Erwinia haradaeae TaxID=1922217 RepID=A0A451D3Z9_9GAMM|nr:type I DNA topoisomerase [Candidatus Erwinia haradaeae]VFP80425.1 DNA topoisomerase 1 [Candidatus Erwinia haradaeae]
MGKALVIVESPAKAKTINQYLGGDYIVKSSVGHIRDLPINGSSFYKSTDFITGGNHTKIKKNKITSLVSRMGVNPFDNWEANYYILPGKEKVVSELKEIAKKVDHIYLATDLDREGEAIAWHLKEIIGGEQSRYSRVVFNEITQSSISQAFSRPGVVNMCRVNAQQARRFMDRVVGYMISPILWKKISRGLSAGRVQSVAVRLVVEREREIKAFIPTVYWTLHAFLKTSDDIIFQMKVTQYLKKSFCPINLSEIDNASILLSQSSFIVKDCIEKLITLKPGAPFTTSTLQQTASTRLGFSVKRTMMMAQRLYEAGYITYIRTDSTNLSQDALVMARSYIKEKFGIKYLPKIERVYRIQGNGNEAHEAIRPSDVKVLSMQLQNMSADAKKLYQLIWRQFVTCQMVSAQYNSRTLIVEAKDFKLSLNGRILFFDGWMKVIPSLRKDHEAKIVPKLVVGSELSLKKLLPNQHFTQSPARFNEALLVRELEKRGIGRPSTYASIIATIQERGYVKLDSRRFYANKIGEIVTDRLIENFPDLMNYNFTAHMEDNLDQVANNTAEWKMVLDDFFIKFREQLTVAQRDPTQGGMRPNKIVNTSIECPSCRRQMNIRTAKTGVFLGCCAYTLEPKLRCKQTIHLIQDNSALLNMSSDNNNDTDILCARRRCKLCGVAMDVYFIDHERKLHICGDNPECDGYEIECGKFNIKSYVKSVMQCEKCNADMFIKLGRFGEYVACVNHDCKNTRKIMRNGDIAPPKTDPVPLPGLMCTKSDAFFVLRDGASGMFLAANTFPKSRETRAPQVVELQRYRDILPEKWLYLANAPTMDPDGNIATIHFSRKTKKQYVSTKKDGKSTGWFAYFINGQWEEFQR